jgi:hypothetical protein
MLHAPIVEHYDSEVFSHALHARVSSLRRIWGVTDGLLNALSRGCTVFVGCFLDTSASQRFIKAS